MASLPPSGSVSEAWWSVRLPRPGQRRSACASPACCAAFRHRRRFVGFASVCGSERQERTARSKASSSRAEGTRPWAAIPGDSETFQAQGRVGASLAAVAPGLPAFLTVSYMPFRLPVYRSFCFWTQVCSVTLFSRHLRRGRVCGQVLLLRTLSLDLRAGFEGRVFPPLGSSWEPRSPRVPTRERWAVDARL